MRNFGMIMNRPHPMAVANGERGQLIERLRSYRSPPTQILAFARKPVQNTMSMAAIVAPTSPPSSPPTSPQTSPREAECPSTVEEYIERIRYIPDEIPKKLFQTWHTKELPPKMRETVDRIKRQNPNFEHYLFDEEECRNFIAEFFDEEILRAYNSLIPIAYKSDLWRYCVLYIHGGVYIDVKFEQISSAASALAAAQEHFVLDYGANSDISAIYNGFIICKPNNPIMHDAIYEIVKNIKNNDMKNDALEPTGPKLLGKIINLPKNQKYKKNVDLALHVTEDDVLYIKGRGDSAAAPLYKIYDEYRTEKNNNKNHLYYATAHSNKMIYSTNDLSIRENVIPMHVYQTWQTKKLPKDMKRCNDLLKEQNPEFEFHLYDDADCRSFIQENYDENVLRAFDKLIPGAFKADLWRYCILYKYGGIYLDCKYFCMNDFKLSYFLRDEYFVKDMFVLDIFNAVMVCKPNNPLLWDCIQQVVKNVREEYYGPGTLNVTGPAMIRYLYPKYSENYNTDLYHKGSPKINGLTVHGTIFSEKYNKFILATYPSYRHEQKTYSDKTHYGIYWHNRQVYDASALALDPEPR